MNKLLAALARKLESRDGLAFVISLTFLALALTPLILAVCLLAYLLL
jgi:hypothetical protein